MGIIKRQGIKQTLVLYGGTLFGMLNVLYFYPKFLAPEELGLIRFLIDSSFLFAPFVLMGVTNISIRYFPEFKNSHNGHNGFFSFLVLYSIIGMVFASLIFFIFRDDVYAYYAKRDTLFAEYFYLVWIGVILVGLSSVLIRYTANFKRIVIPTLINDYLLKIGSPILAGLFFFGYIDLDVMLFGILGLFGLDILLQLVYLSRLRELKFRSFFGFVNLSKLRNIFIYGLFGLLSGLGTRIISFLDSFMVATLYSLDGLAVFYIAFVIAQVMVIPSRAINYIASPFISSAWHRSDTSEIKKIYQKSSMVLLTLGLGIFLLIWTNVDSFYKIMPNGEFYAQGKNVILILAIAKLIDLSTAINGQIIDYSKYYRFNLYSLGVLAISNILLNIALIPTFGIIGAAWASLISLTLFNAVKFGFVWYRFGMQPFDIKSLKMAIAGLLLIFAGQLLPLTINPFFDIIFHSLIVCIAFGSLIVFTTWCPDLRETLVSLYKRIFSVIKGN